jgi:uncharacterized protein (TIGR00156 family)
MKQVLPLIRIYGTVFFITTLYSSSVKSSLEKVETFSIQTSIGINSHLESRGGSEGFYGPSRGLVKVRDVLDAGFFSDDRPVTLTGYITSFLGGEMYLFTDGIDNIHVEIDQEVWRGISINSNTKVTISGTIDKEFAYTSIEVDAIRIIQ